MYRLYHYPLCPFSRKVRVVLDEKRIPFVPSVEEFWQKRERFLQLNPMGIVPFIVVSENCRIAGSMPICEFLEDIDEENKLIINTPEERAEIRRMVLWFDEKFFREVSEHILYERVFNFFQAKVEPNQSILKLARSNLIHHLKYIQFLLSNSTWICGENFSLADIAAACHISVLDYLGEINWTHYPVAKEWYAIIKSRPSFRVILQDLVSGFKPSTHYKELDF